MICLRTASASHQPPSVATAAPIDTADLAMLPASDRAITNAIRLPLSKEVPYFVTDPADAGHDFSRITLAASDF